MEKFIVRFIRNGRRHLEHEYVFRYDPVPMCSHNVVGHKCYRRPRTTPELRDNVRDKDYTRGKRRNIPNSWDDIPTSTYRSRCWKDCSKKKRKWMKERR